MHCKLLQCIMAGSRSRTRLKPCLWNRGGGGSREQDGVLGGGGGGTDSVLVHTGYISTGAILVLGFGTQPYNTSTMPQAGAVRTFPKRLALCLWGAANWKSYVCIKIRTLDSLHTQSVNLSILFLMLFVALVTVIHKCSGTVQCGCFRVQPAVVGQVDSRGGELVIVHCSIAQRK